MREQGKEKDKNIKSLQDDLIHFGEAVKQIDALKLETASQKLEIKDLTHQNTVLRERLEAALKALKDSGKHARWEESVAVRKEINKWIKDKGYRETKFAKDTALDAFVQAVYDGIKERLSLDDVNSDAFVPTDDFSRIYMAHINAQLSVRRQYTQSMCLKAVTRTYQ